MFKLLLSLLCSMQGTHNLLIPASEHSIHINNRSTNTSFEPVQAPTNLFKTQNVALQQLTSHTLLTKLPNLFDGNYHMASYKDGTGDHSKAK